MLKFSRTSLLIGEEALQVLNNSHVAVFGLGGVGGYVCEMLVRAGVGNLTIIDFDVVDITNINRQIIALTSTVGKPKCEVLKERLLDINPNCNIHEMNEKYTPENYKKFFNAKYDYVVDAIDMVTSKINLIVKCHENNIPIISAMGAGNRSDIPNFIISDIYKTFNDGLAKVMRKKLKENGVVKHNVVFSETKASPCGDTIGSISYYPAMCGCILAAFVIRSLIK